MINVDFVSSTLSKVVGINSQMELILQIAYSLKEEKIEKL